MCVTHRSFVPLRNAAYDHWSARLQASASGSVRQTFRALNQGLAVQLQQLLADRDRLHKRIHTNRAQYRVLGTKRTAETAGLNNEIVDDSDFYQQLLAQVIEAKAASAGACPAARSGEHLKSCGHG
jgi:delta 1-pyrroline-5-carboxylate dehydrogenase